jgi:hypothetical protein
MEYDLSSDFSEGPGSFLLHSRGESLGSEEKKESIVIVSKDYRVNYTDQYLVIRSHSPRIIRLYDLPLEMAGSDLVHYTLAIHIKSLAVTGVHKISAGKYNTIDEYAPCYELGTGNSVTLVPVGNTWYSFK